MKPAPAILFASLFFLLCALSACSPAAWIKGEEEPDLVGADGGDIPVFDQLTLVTNKLLANHRTATRAQGKMNVAFVGVENRSAEEIRDIREALYEVIDTILVNDQTYVPVNRRFVEEAMRATGQRPESLFLQSGREEFMAAVSREGVAPDYLLFAVVTTMTSTGVDEDQRNYQLTLELVDANSGVTVAKETDRVRKGFNK
ncbi:MAG: hypothetical protein HY812_07850 [Planctomycetes bacterium]|nr:hypothetical protein [Planctomycetota bacterium]